MVRKKEEGLNKNKVITELTKSPHGKLEEYLSVGQEAANKEPEFLAHLIAWDKIKGQIRDSKAALPVIALSVSNFPEEYVENSLAHLAALSPRELLKAYEFALKVKLPGRMKGLKRLVARYLKHKEGNGFDRVAVIHKESLKRLYALTHTKPGEHADRVVMKGIKPAGSIFDKIAQLKNMSPKEAAGTILNDKIPFIVAIGALGVKAKEPDLVLALIERMSPTELTTNSKMLERLGVKTVPALRDAYAEALKKAATSKKTTLKATKAAEAVEDEGLKKKLQALQEKQLKALGGVDGNWLVLADKSGSMNEAIETARQVSAILSKMVNGNVYLVFFDTSVRGFDVTGKTLEEITAITKGITAMGGTSVGAGLDYAIKKGWEFDAIAIVSDAEENSIPLFKDVYKRYVEKEEKVTPVYLYKVDCSPALKARYPNEHDTLTPGMAAAGFDMQNFELGYKPDYYSLPNLVQTMRVNRFSLIDEIFATELLTLKEVFKEE